MPDDFTADTTTLGVITPDTPVTGVLETEEDADWFRFEVDRTGYGIRFEESDVYQIGTIDIYDANGVLVHAGSWERSDYFLPTRTGTYFAEVAFDFVNSPDLAGRSYTLTMTVPEDDIGADIDYSRFLYDQTLGYMDYAGDRDMFRIEGLASQTYVIGFDYWEDIESFAVPNEPMIFGGIYRADGSLIDGTEVIGQNRNAQLVFRPETNGKYYLEVLNKVDHRGAYILSVNYINEGPNTWSASETPIEIFMRGGNDTANGSSSDTIHGGTGHDFLTGGTLYGGTGFDLLRGTGRDNMIWGGPQGDTIMAGGGDDQVRGGLGADIVWLGNGNDLFTDTEQGGYYGGDIVSGGEGDDTILGLGGFDRMSGEQGDDSITGGRGWDTLAGGAGDDTLDGGSGNDEVTGGLGSDLGLLGPGWDIWHDHDDPTGNDTVDGGTGWDRIESLGGDDVLTGGGRSLTLQGLTDPDALLADLTLF